MENTNPEEEIDQILEQVEPQFDASDDKTVSNARKKMARVKQKRAAFIREMMNTENGRLWVYDILVMGHIAGPVHTPGDPYATAYKDGERNIANKILFDINEFAPEMYMQMLKDGRSEK